MAHDFITDGSKPSEVLSAIPPSAAAQVPEAEPVAEADEKGVPPPVPPVPPVTEPVVTEPVVTAPEPEPAKEPYRPTQHEYSAYMQMPPEEQFAKSQEWGYIPKGSEYVPSVTQEQISEIERELLAAGAPPTEEMIAELKQLEPKEWGYFGPGQLVQREEALEVRAVAVKEYMAAVGEQRKAREETLEALEPYKVAGGYDLTAAIREGKINEVREAGFDPMDVVAAQSAVAEPAIAEVPEVPAEAVARPWWQQMESLGWLPRSLEGFQTITPLSTKAQRRLKMMLDWKKEVPDNPTEVQVTEAWNKLSLFDRSTMVGTYTTFSEEYQKGVLEGIIALTPVAGTIYYWNRMSTTGKAVSVVLDVAFFVTPFITAKLPAMLSRLRGPLRQVTKLADAGIKETIEVLRGVNPRLVAPFTKLTLAQQRYAAALAKLDQIRQAIRAAKGEVLVNLREQLPSYERIVQQTELELRAAGREYSGAIRGAGIGADSPAVLESLERLPRDIVTHTKATVSSVMGVEVTIAEMEAALTLAEQQLRTAKQRWPTVPEAWSDLSQDVAKLKAQIAAREAGSVVELHTQLVTMREAIPELEKMVREARVAGSPYLGDLERSLARARRLVESLPKQIDDLLNAMELEWGRGGPISAGAVRTGTRAPSTSPYATALETEMARLGKRVPVLGGGRSIGPAAMVVEVVAPLQVKTITGVELPSPYPRVDPKRRVLPIKPHLVEVEVEVEPAVKPKVWPVHPPEPAPYTPGVEAAPELEPKPGVIAVTYPEEAVRAAEETAVERRARVAVAEAVAAETMLAQVVTPTPTMVPAIRPLFAPAPAPYVPTPVPTPTPTPTEPVVEKPRVPPTRPVVLLPKLPEGEEDRKEYVAGTVVWRQGAWWKIISPPYAAKKPLSDRLPPVGVEVIEGTPQETLTFIGGVIPTRNISFDLGVTDGFIDVERRRIVFTGHGEETDVGVRLPSPTKGLTMKYVKPVRRRKGRVVPRRPTPSVVQVIFGGPEESGL